MIYTVTFNPSLDYTVTVDDFKIGYTSRTTSENLLIGGKGINVSIVLKNLGFNSTALGFVAGFTGDEICKGLNDRNINTDFIKTENGFSRINVKLISNDGTEINGNGPEISKNNINEMLEKIDTLKDDDILVLAGSIPKSVNSNIYSDILKKLQGKKVLTIVDATKELLCNVLKYKPFLIKPNKQELEEIFNTKIKTEDEVVFYGNKLKNMGAKNVLISLGAKGAVLICENGEVYKEKAVFGTLVNSVGAGDSMVAGFLAGYLENKNFSHAFKMALATGCASAFSENLATKDDVDAIYKKY